MFSRPLRPGPGDVPSGKTLCAEVDLPGWPALVKRSSGPCVSGQPPVCAIDASTLPGSPPGATAVPIFDLIAADTRDQLVSESG
jgi:hypothetical protein